MKSYISYPVDFEKYAWLSILISVLVVLVASTLHQILGLDLTDLSLTRLDAEATLDNVS